ncbi:class I SAM-dependent methyltransferase [Flaviaesturariibacter aridisoli]|uniref:Class I SAM-dependent methyltransferase n=1 Tax=Flaviaesturariibacter aridisoli TaxID=2545761 RepID=A0A4R4DYI5_9BACT|nr:class I SAM-dependent methyltransferase [Flaviaesturariibacter aridisoli]TCZ70606.1 class I SAM-dependent methyltransferase [Flaviaesturariibacter aridisoli]
MSRAITISEQPAAEAFSRQAPLFDGLYGSNPIIAYKRARVRAQVERHLAPASRILELNCGTGEDALYFSSKGHSVLATDVSEAMLAQLRQKAFSLDGCGHLEARHCSYHDLRALPPEAPFDLVFSNFGGLNCTDRLADVLQSAADLLRPGGLLTVVVIPPFCLWESLLLLKGEWRTATRRWFSRGGASAQVEGQRFRCWYYRPVFIRKALRAEFNVLELEGLCTLVPPSYRERFPKRFPRLLHLLQRWEDRWAHRWPWRSVGDYFIMTLQKRGGA